MRSKTDSTEKVFDQQSLDTHWVLLECLQNHAARGQPRQPPLVPCPNHSPSLRLWLVESPGCAQCTLRGPVYCSAANTEFKKLYTFLWMCNCNGFKSIEFKYSPYRSLSFNMKKQPCLLTIYKVQNSKVFTTDNAK